MGLFGLITETNPIKVSISINRDCKNIKVDFVFSLNKQFVLVKACFNQICIQICIYYSDRQIISVFPGQAA